MTVRELIKELIHLHNLDAEINIASDDEGNSYGDIDRNIARMQDKDTKNRVYVLYPKNSMLPEDKYYYNFRQTIDLERG